MVTKGELGRPVERLWEQMEKLQLRSSHRSEGEVVMLEQQLPVAEESLRRLEAAETRAEIAERRVSTREVWKETNRSELREELSTLPVLTSSFVSFSRLLTYRGAQKRQKEEPEIQRIPLPIS